MQSTLSRRQKTSFRNPNMYKLTICKILLQKASVLYIIILHKVMLKDITHRKEEK